jgi:hypothetical protein
MDIGATKGAEPRRTGMTHPKAIQAQPTRSRPPKDVSGLNPMVLTAEWLRDFRLTTARYLGLKEAGPDKSREVPGAAGSVT